MAELDRVPPTRLLMIDIDLAPSRPWLKHYRRKVKLVLESYGLRPTAIRITRSRSKGYHARIYLNEPVLGQFANMLQWLLCDDSPRVGFNEARINAGFDEWDKLFEEPGMRMRRL